MIKSEYNREQITALHMIRSHLDRLSYEEINGLKERITHYLIFRKTVDDFQEKYLSRICTDKCFSSRESACCNREGIATFFADAVINSLQSSPEELDRLEYAILHDQGGFKCVYLSKNGCLWNLKPIVCEMFLCDHAMRSLCESDDSLIGQWEEFRTMERQFTWPDRPVLFNELEKLFMLEGLDSPIMYFHKSPGLLKVKAKNNVD